jgi:hypothetical protein
MGNALNLHKMCLGNFNQSCKGCNVVAFASFPLILQWQIRDCSAKTKKKRLVSMAIRDLSDDKILH